MTLGECETRTLKTGARLVLRPATLEKDETDLERGVASLHRDEDLWWRGFWANQWHFAATEGDLRELLAEDLEAGRVPIGAPAAASEF